jgi:hypothetical protein
MRRPHSHRQLSGGYRDAAVLRYQRYDEVFKHGGVSSAFMGFSGAMAIAHPIETLHEKRMRLFREFYTASHRRRLQIIEEAYGN